MSGVPDITTVAAVSQEAHEKDRIWQLLADESLPETIAAWTTDLSIAKNFKNGVPPDGLRGVIFSFDAHGGISFLSDRLTSG
ncbi:MAG: hypothetical protein CVT70_18610 [Alphaproteobacteria bacterium HGW-Alphaproteobacteria-1]|nr:MAG: hypothetical protein CVT70_18610 [Alphaproteobacteria bacterium HGW-Alphaproteobacteria-1]